MRYRIESPENVFTSTANTIKSCFLSGVIAGVLVSFTLYKVATWDGWTARSATDPPPSLGPDGSHAPPPSPLPAGRPSRPPANPPG